MAEDFQPGDPDDVPKRLREFTGIIVSELSGDVKNSSVRISQQIGRTMHFLSTQEGGRGHSVDPAEAALDKGGRGVELAGQLLNGDLAVHVIGQILTDLLGQRHLGVGKTPLL